MTIHAKKGTRTVTAMKTKGMWRSEYDRSNAVA
jgi:hypothetical protein